MKYYGIAIETEDGGTFLANGPMTNVYENKIKDYNRAISDCEQMNNNGEKHFKRIRLFYLIGDQYLNDAVTIDAYEF